MGRNSERRNGQSRATIQGEPYEVDWSARVPSISDLSTVLWDLLKRLLGGLELLIAFTVATVGATFALAIAKVGPFMSLIGILHIWVVNSFSLGTLMQGVASVLLFGVFLACIELDNRIEEW
jgi:hypothetical protein